ncbi:acylneuraminate cytidylyltransferase family protein [Psychrobacter sp.]|uniref:acylneuraminate cytidylyltransferase family protein n=1 Tax=Psychrobacter sp. TaxID=56811 RepID=UPI002FDB5BEC
MLNEKTFLAIIPARGGSKRLPRKNILNLAGKPLIAWTIEAALQSKYIDKVLVTSDDDEILKVSNSYGASTIKRPMHLSQDNSTSFEAINHAIENTEEFDYIVLLQPTSPLRTNGHIDEAIQLIFQKNSDAIISVTEMEHSPLWANTLPENKSLKDFLKEEIFNKRSQDLETYFRLNGAIYICKTEELLYTGSVFLKNNCYAYQMNNIDSVDIDTEMDFKWAEFLYGTKNDS